MTSMMIEKLSETFGADIRGADREQLLLDDALPE
jgi:hypothetical protein